MVSVKARVKRHLARVPGATALARLTVETIRVCLRYRVTGLASEAGFFMLLSLPPLLLGLFGGVGYVGQWLGQETVDEITGGIQTWAERFLTDTLITDALLPTVNDVLGRGRLDLISVGFLLSIWSGSRALNVFVDTISIMYGQSGVRGIVQTRALSLTLYLVSLVVGIIVIPLVLIGPTWLEALLPESLDFLFWLYWPVVTFIAVASLTTLYHISTPRRTPWLRDMPGAVLTMVIWALSSFVLRGTVAASLGGTSIYGPLSTPIVLLIWLYFLAIAILIGAALNAAIRLLWPVQERPSARARAVGWVKQEVRRRRAAEEVAGPSGVAGEPEAAAEVFGGLDGAPGEPVGTPGEPVGAPAGAGAGDGTEEPAAAKRKKSRPLTPLPEDPERVARKAARKAARRAARSAS
ncbi:YihY/virulence factor BrkB family protein [Knoellia sp. 3-2P3]|uniref:YihY/virulence factor BrkB family protein n=1 Tax=unclassified Knoellia TaxID=2618719 RepID=UPI0023DC459F|nr:YihY/virulence factor BrkB family protein [Knoellia sp. 3-2P3]MDF2092272.1 YihY/virulence factor BrkB family protein [Knoellia sp. 3-2P3]